MIARICRSATLRSEAARYLAYLNEMVIPGYRRAEGNAGAFVLQENQENLTNFMLLSFWESAEALARYAGPQIETAVRDAQAQEAQAQDAQAQDAQEYNLLVAYESVARHYEVIG